MRLFVDTGAWLALNDKNDQYHTKAIDKSSKIKMQKIELLTSEYVIDESITIIRFKISHETACLFGESLFASSIVKIIGITEEDRSKAWEMFKKYKDKEFSFTDCTSFVLMKKLNLKKAFAFDNHFKQVGFDVF
jgi:predicted nucleic acid-binding protein